MPPTSAICSPPNPVSLDHPSASSVRGLLSPEDLLCDPRFEQNGGDDPHHWSRSWQEDSSFRLSEGNRSLFFALNTLRSYLSGSDEDLTETGRTRLTRWLEMATGEGAHPLDQTALRNLRQILAAVRGPAQAQAEQVLEIIGRPVASAPAEEPTPEEGTEPEPAQDEGEGTPPPRQEDSFQMQSMTLETHFADEFFRPLPGIVTLGVLPAEGLSQLQSSTAAFRLGAEARIGGLNFFARLFGGDARPDGNPEASFGQAGVIVGLYELANPTLGNRGDGFYFTLGGMSQAGIGVGVGWCTGIDHSEVSGAECPEDPTVQISTFGESDLFSLGIENFELGVRLMPSSASLNLGGEGLAEFDRDPIAFRLTYYFNPPPRRPDQSPIRTGVSDEETAFTALSMANGYILNNFRRRQEAAFESSRPFFFGNPDQFSLLNVGSAFNAILEGLDSGGLAYRLHWNLRHGNDAQRAVVGVLMGAEFLANVIGAAATSGEPGDLQGGSFRLGWPMNLVRDGLAVGGALGLLGDRNEAILGEDGAREHFAIGHGLVGLAGLVLALTSGDFSGDGFFGWSIIGNQPPGEEEIALEESRFSLDDQRSQYIRMGAGLTALSYSLTGLVDLLVAMLQVAQAGGGSDSEEATSPDTSSLPISAYADLSPRRLELGLRGQW